MSADFRSARFWARELIERALLPGGCAIDATMGNGHDTQWLCELVGETGRIYAFDVQAEAVARTAERLKEHALEQRAKLYCAGHERMTEFVPEKVDAIVFNLGWLPGAEHGVTTQVETTLKAAEAALELLVDGGVMTTCIYPGHDEGARERDALIKWAQSLDDRLYDAMIRTYLNQPNNPPLMLAIRKKLQKK